MEEKVLNCCEDGKNYILYHYYDGWNMEDESGFVIDINNGSYPDTSFSRINFCPFCGQKIDYSKYKDK